MGSSRFWLKAADKESKSIPHELPRSHWLKATGQCVLERYLSATMKNQSMLFPITNDMCISWEKGMPLSDSSYCSGLIMSDPDRAKHLWRFKNL